MSTTQHPLKHSATMDTNACFEETTMKEQNLEALTASPETASSSPPSSSCKLSSSNAHDTQVKETHAAVAKSTTLASTEDLGKNLARQKSEAIEASEDAATEEYRNVAKPPDASGKIKLGQPPDIPHSLPESSLPTFANTIVMHTFKGTSKGIFRQVSHNGAVVRKFRYNDNSNLWNEWNAIRSVHETKSTCSIVQAIQYNQHGAYEILDTKYIPGESLENTWASLSQESKVKMASDVLATLSEIKSTHAHDKIAASDAKSGFEWNGLLWQKPVSTTDFILDIISFYVPPSHVAMIQAWARQRLSTLDSKTFLTHLDLHPCNLIVDPISRKLTIIDWEQSGYFPSWWMGAQVMTYPLGIPSEFQYMLYELNEWTQESWEIAFLVRALSVFGVLTNTQEERRSYRQKGWSHLSSLSGLESLATSDVPKFNYASLKRISGTPTAGVWPWEGPLDD